VGIWRCRKKVKGFKIRCVITGLTGVEKRKTGKGRESNAQATKVRPRVVGGGGKKVAPGKGVQKKKETP